MREDPVAVLRSPFANGTRLAGFEIARLLAPAQAVLLYLGAAALRAPAVETVALEAAAGRVLGRDAIAHEDHPSHARSTMDGFALASGEASPRRRIVGEVAMGRPAPRALGADEAMRVPTGGALPEGADAVVPQEDVASDGDAIVLGGRVDAGAFVSPRASDIASGETVLRAGRRLGGPELGVLATLGIAAVPVFRRPRVAVVSTGDELVDPRDVPRLGEIRDSNRYAVGATLTALGAEVAHVPRCPDTPAALRAAFASALADCDAIVTTGGSSVGERDLVPHIVAGFGAPGTLVHGLRVKPGKPTLLGAIAGTAVIGLPGNPTSALMILEAVVRPIVAALAGARDDRRIVLDAIAGAPFLGRDGWTHYVPARLVDEGGRLVAVPLPIRSAQTSLLARASGYATVGESSSRVEAGGRVPIALFAAGGAPIAGR